MTAGMQPLLPSNPALIELADALGTDTARDVVRVFLQTFPSMLHELGQRDRDRSRRAAHGLKSSARQMGAVALSDQLAEIEKRLGGPDEKVTAADLAAVAMEFAATAGPLRDFAKGGK
jgi:HPt (histidine-containing phosphotransfer) domain-containing protein